MQGAVHIMNKIKVIYLTNVALYKLYNIIIFYNFSNIILFLVSRYNFLHKDFGYYFDIREKEFKSVIVF